MLILPSETSAFANSTSATVGTGAVNMRARARIANMEKQKKAGTFKSLTLKRPLLGRTARQ